MASWIVHLRLCDRLIDSLGVPDRLRFAAGNIAPDCGDVLDYGVYDPPVEISHFTPTGKKGAIQHERFYSEYCIDADPDSRWLYLGYYVHLLTDFLWVRDIYYPDKEKYRNNFIHDDRFALVFKKDWYDCDRLFLREHPDFRSYKLILSYDERRRYFDFYSPDAIVKKVRFIENYYLPDGRKLDREYPYVSPERVDRFVDNAAKELTEILREKLM